MDTFKYLAVDCVYLVGIEMSSVYSSFERDATKNYKYKRRFHFINWFSFIKTLVVRAMSVANIVPNGKNGIAPTLQ